jgi:hypothetical protein
LDFLVFREMNCFVDALALCVINQHFSCFVMLCSKSKGDAVRKTFASPPAPCPARTLVTEAGIGVPKAIAEAVKPDPSRPLSGEARMAGCCLTLMST